MKKILIASATSLLILATSTANADLASKLIGDTLIEAVAAGGDLAESIGCATGGVKAETLDVIQRVIIDGEVDVGEDAELEAATASGLCVKGKAKIEQIVEADSINIDENGCASLATTGRNAGC